MSEREPITSSDPDGESRDTYPPGADPGIADALLAGDPGDDGDHDLTLAELVERAAAHTHVLYLGEETPHRSCGIAIAETFGRDTRAYQALRKGGLTGCGECGAIKGGELVLGELLGDPDPRGGATERLRWAAARYRELWQASIDRRDAPEGDIVCNTLTGQFETFGSRERHLFCTNLATTASRCVAQVLAELRAREDGA